jgi:3-hydroxymyristoyl/3-hydroxydecanoyl-(acyl carrier protein) dehydratase
MPPLLYDTPTDTVPLSLEQTVPRAWVHKHSLDNVLLTEIRSCGTDRFICAGRLPTAHCFFNDAGRTPHSDILFYTELGRQASLAMCHAFLDVSAEDVFIFEGSDAVITDAAWTPVTGSPRNSVAIEIRLAEVTRRKNNAISRVVTEHTMWVGTGRVFHGTGAFTIQPAALFQRLRRNSGARTTAPASATPQNRTIESRTARVPRSSGANIAISTPRRDETTDVFAASLIVDHTHPYFFDHPCDHVPGMLLLEGCAQLAQAAFGETIGADAAGVTGYEVNFTQFVETGIPATLTARVDRVDAYGATAGDIRWPSVRLVISQQATVCGTATLRLALPTAS